MHGLATDPAPSKGHVFCAPGSKGENVQGGQAASPRPYREKAAKGNGEFCEASSFDAGPRRCNPGAEEAKSNEEQPVKRGQILTSPERPHASH